MIILPWYSVKKTKQNFIMVRLTIRSFGGSERVLQGCCLSQPMQPWRSHLETTDLNSTRMPKTGEVHPPRPTFYYNTILVKTNKRNLKKRLHQPVAMQQESIFGWKSLAQEGGELFQVFDFLLRVLTVAVRWPNRWRPAKPAGRQPWATPSSDTDYGQ